MTVRALNFVICKPFLQTNVTCCQGAAVSMHCHKFALLCLTVIQKRAHRNTPAVLAPSPCVPKQAPASGEGGNAGTRDANYVYLRSLLSHREYFKIALHVTD
jgi:hypothetical protein